LQIKSPNLIADIGGTNARFALVDDAESQPFEAKTLRCADYDTLVDATEAYLKQVNYPRPQQAAFSMATPVSGDQLEMTNHIWRFSIRQTRRLLGFGSLKVLNDYTALALALPHFSTNDCLQIGGDQKPQGPVMAVLGPGTGLGVSAVTKAGNLWVPLQGEGGHVSYGPLDDREAGVITIMRRKLEHVSAESLISGPGISLLYQSIATLDGIPVAPIEPKEITAMAIQRNSAVAEEAVSMFCGILGTVAGNLALTLGARGGVFIGGGIVPQLGECFSQSSFRSRFEKHGRFTQYLQKIPTHVIQSKYPALQGAAIALSEDHENLGVTSVEGEI
jgi:glucokinase